MPGARIAIPALSVLGGGLAALLSSLLVRVLMARTLSPNDVGVLLFAIAVVSAAGGIASLGTNAGLAHRVAERRARGDEAGARRTARTGLFLAATSGGVAFLLLALAGPWLGTSAAAVLPLAPVALGLAAGTAVLGAARAFGDVAGRALLRDTGGGFLRLAGVGLATLAAPTPRNVALGYAAGCLLGELAFGLYGLGRGWFRSASGTPPDRALPRTLRPFAGMEAVAQAATWVDVIVLGALAPPAVVGVYGVARSLPRVLEVVRQAASHGFLPAATEAGALAGPDAVGRLRVAARLFSLVLVWPLLAVCLVAPGEALAVLFGAAYAGAGTVLAILAVGSLVGTVLDDLDLGLVALGEAAATVRTTAAATAIGACALAVAVPLYGATGAAAASTAAVAIRGGLLLSTIGRRGRLAPWLRGLFRPLALGLLVVAATGLALRGLALPPLVGIAAALGGGVAASVLSLRAFLAGGAGLSLAGTQGGAASVQGSEGETPGRVQRALRAR